MHISEKIQRLLQKGVVMPAPDQVLVGEEVSSDRIAGGVVIYPGCRILGSSTSIMEGAKLGSEGPVTIADCQLGPRVELKGGYFREAVFLEKAAMGLGAHVREGCLLEEQASGAHTVGLKQTILFPFVTLGSLINFCDCLMAGGTSRQNHSEVGSSYIHFNYSAYQDKATASLLGDVSRGVMLDQPPIFLGGQGGLVGPVRLGFGTVIAAGVVCRRDVPQGSRLVLTQDPGRDESGSPEGWGPAHHPGMYRHVKRRVRNNIDYIANLMAMRQWYLAVRALFFRSDPLEERLFAGALEKLDMAVHERVRRLGQLADKMPLSAQTYRRVAKGEHSGDLLRQKEEFFERWEDVAASLEENGAYQGEPSVRDSFLEEVCRVMGQEGRDYIRVIGRLDTPWKAHGTAWLQQVVDRVNHGALDKLPSFL